MGQTPSRSWNTFSISLLTSDCNRCSSSLRKCKCQVQGTTPVAFPLGSLPSICRRRTSLRHPPYRVSDVDKLMGPRFRRDPISNTIPTSKMTHTPLSRRCVSVYTAAVETESLPVLLVPCVLETGNLRSGHSTL